MSLLSTIHISADRPPLLVDDVLLRIFCSCNIHVILTLSQSSRHFHDLAFSKQVWLAVLSDLQRRNFIDLLPGQQLNQLTSNELVNLAKRAVLGPRSWTDTSRPRIASQFILKSSITDPDNGNNIADENKAELLPGGQFLLFRHQETLECLTVQEGKHLWQYRGPWVNSNVQAFAAVVTDDGRACIIIVGIRTYALYGEDDELNQNYVEILHLDFSTGSATTLIRERVPKTIYDNAFSGLKICGDFAIAAVRHANYILVFKLSTRSYKPLADSTGLHLIDLIPGHVLLLTPNYALKTVEIWIWSIESLFESIEHSPRITDIAPVMKVAVEGVIVHQAYRLSVHPSPLWKDSSTLWVLVSSTRSNPPASLFHKYRISHPKGGLLSVNLVSTTKVDKAYPISDRLLNVSHAGNVEVFDNREEHFFSLTSPGEHIDIDLPDRGNYIHMSPYSGALTYVTNDVYDEKIFVNYYE
ncbi:hypothetical protein Hypma_010969 [Hypsizygus marmoreus]|uniref:F-box domain-containing protein n=1 Tax=Hypsizygus marmoreus TaxID=39966 RepID=A0A369JMY6_HYPMA|nr:hypothetical protein Hypma_010969 [Hypsizygus marmoreus]